MKITRIEINDFQQFKDFTLDLTYPAGHPKAGEPLDKVCFIGQSGTGKTTILDLVSFITSNEGSRNNVWGNELEVGKAIYKLDFNLLRSENKGSYTRIRLKNNRETTIYKADFNLQESEWKKILYNNWRKNFLIYLQTGLENHISSLFAHKDEPKPLIHIEQDGNSLNIDNRFITVISLKSNDCFSDSEFRDFLLKDIDGYDFKQREVLNGLFKQAFNKNVEKVLQEVQTWKTENPNPRIEIDEKLRPILEHFNVKLDTDWADGGLKIKTLQDKEFDLNLASTGTKQILVSALPLALMETDNKVILFDEPERSLYPDTQRSLVDFYVNIAPKAQFFFATHSPLIASQFEPCERFILTFDENGNVQAHNGVAPQGDDPNDILTKDFLMPTLLGAAGEKAYQRFLELKSLIRKESNQDEKDKLTNEYLTLQKNFNF